MEATAPAPEVPDGTDAIDEPKEEEEQPPIVEDPYCLESGDPPVKIEPEEALLPVQGTATFTVTMFGSKATMTSDGHYQYRLVGEGRYAQDPNLAADELEKAEAQTPAPEVTQNLVVEDKTARGSKRGSKLVQGVARLPEIQLDNDELHDDDSDIERIPSGRKESDKTQKLKLESVETNEVVQKIISTLTIDCVGDCIVPRLTVDKKADHDILEFDEEDGRQVPVYKFVHSN